AGTDPMATPAEAPPGEGGFAVAVALEAGSVLVSFPAVAAAGVGYDGCTRHYSLERKSGSDTDTWLAVAGYADIVAAGQTVRYRPPTGDGSPVFYRARVWLAGP
ncbi:MAG: hypothetical protein JXR37_20875, partial [Kiritimatiellae bacterium]|nr:hypothetical protein [Kiritimatiellia bacterium]